MSKRGCFGPGRAALGASHGRDPTAGAHAAGGAAACAPFPWASSQGTLTALAHGLAGALEAWRRRRGVERTAAVLSRLDDRTLYDIGISRAQIPAVARVVAERPGCDPRKLQA